MSLALVKESSLQRIKQLVIRVSTTFAELPSAYDRDESDPVDAFQQLFEKGFARGRFTTSRKRTLLPRMG
jgi:hypothetical protein